MKKIIIGILVILFLVLLVSCGGSGGGTAISKENVIVVFDYNKFKKEEALWNTSKPPNYQFNFYLDNNNNLNYGSVYVNTLIIVENGAFKNQIPVDYNGYTHKTYRNETIDDVYEYIEKEYLRYNNYRPKPTSSTLTQIDIEYDTKNHIPIEVKLCYQLTGVLPEISYSTDLILITEYKVND
jgi:hypothetical protein